MPIPGLEWLGTSANMLIAFRTLLVLPSFIRPVVGVVQDIAFGVTGFGPDWSPETEGSQIQITIATRRGSRFLLLFLSFGLCAGAAIALNDFLPEIEALTGSLFKSMNALIVPCCCYCRLCKTRPVQRILIFILVVAAAAWGVYGTYQSVKSMVTSGT